MLSIRQTIHIEWGDCDPAGIVYFPRYFEYFDACTAALFEHAGLCKKEMLTTYGIAGIPVVDLKTRFMASSSFGDDLVVESSITKWGNSSFVVEHRLTKGEVLAVECFETRVWVVRKKDDPNTLQAKPIPEEVKKKFVR